MNQETGEISIQKRQVVLDTETTGLNPSQGHKIVEIGAVEIIDRELTGRQFHYYLNPGRKISKGAAKVHGITDEQLADKPGFAEVADELIEFVSDSYLVAHNAPFDLKFLDAELRQAGKPEIQDHCSVIDTLRLSRNKWPGERNSLDVVADRLGIDRSARADHHGALVDAELLAGVYLTFSEAEIKAEATAGTEARARAKVKDIVGSGVFVGTVSDDMFAGKTVVLTGKMSLTRREATALLQAAGAKVGNSITKKTDYLITAITATDTTSTKSVKAAQMGIEIMDEWQFLEQLNPEPETKAKPEPVEIEIIRDDEWLDDEEPEPKTETAGGGWYVWLAVAVGLSVLYMVMG